jgi:sugar phosphate isomerase/epimerase
VHNGQVVHDNVRLSGPTQGSAYDDEKPVGPLMLQGDHGPVAYRNIWIKPLDGHSGTPWKFFAMDTGTKDENHVDSKQQVDMLQRLAYDGIDYSGCQGKGCGKIDLQGLAARLSEIDKFGQQLFAIYLTARIDADEPRYPQNLDIAMQMLAGRETILWLPLRSKQLPPSDVAGDEKAVSLVRELADAAAAHGLRIALYPHYNFWLEKVEDADRIAKKVNRGNVGVTFNLCHWLRTGGKEVRAVLEQAKPHLFLVTINGADHEGDWRQLIQPLDSGVFDVGEFLRDLNSTGYTGPIGLQGYGIGGDAYDNLQRSMTAWRRLSQY